MYRDIISGIPLWYGHNQIMETKHIHQLLIDVVCTKENVNFKVLFENHNRVLTLPPDF